MVRPHDRPFASKTPALPPSVDSVRQHSVYRYFDLADSFVEILIADARHLIQAGKPGLDKAGYRRLVISTCMPEFREDVAGSIETLFPDDPLMVEDILYQLCIEVNPSLSIHDVRLVASPEDEELDPRGERNAEPARPTPALLRQRVGGLERRLAQNVLGQDHAIQTVTNAVRRAAVGLAPDNRPLASLLFTGRTGTGKTELARRLAQELLGPDALLRIDCSEFALAHEYAKLIGAPPGFVGHEDGGQLTDALRQNPRRVVLFDEVEKAHPKLHNLLLQVLEEGALTDGKGRTVRFDQTLVILTSNVGAEESQRRGTAVGFERAKGLSHDALTEITEQALQNTFAPEFLGRLDETVLFADITPAKMEAIAKHLLRDLRERVARTGTELSFTPAVARWAAQKAYDPAHGARELRRVLRREVESFVAEELSQGTPGRSLRLGVRQGNLRRVA